MLDIFSGLRLVVKRRSISIDNAIFRCHWFFTSTLLVSFSLVITARQYVGQPIECHSVNKIPDSLLNSYCWVQSTFSVPQACNQEVGFEVPYPCIDNARGREVKLFAYYQWVGMVLFIQGLLFHLPYYLWKVWENGLIKAITGGLRVAVISDQERAKKKDIVVEYIHDHLGCHKRYALKYFLCEFICLINLLAQLWATNKFFDGQFLQYGLRVIHYSSATISGQLGLAATPPSPESSQSPPANLSRGIQRTPIRQQTPVDPMMYIFPRMTKCTYYDFGSSGDVQKHDALCLLPLNIINEKIYLALWFWFLVLAILTLLVIVYRLFAIVSETVRCKGLISRCKLSSEKDIRIICRHCDVGDWFLFYMVAENLDPLIMREIVAAIAGKIRAHFDLKRELGMLPEESNVRRSSIYKHRSGSFLQDDEEQLAASFNRASGNSFDETLSAGSRRSSTAQAVGDAATEGGAPLAKKLKKRLYSKRLWSVDFGSAELRQQLFGQQPPTNPDSSFRPLVNTAAPPYAAARAPLESNLGALSSSAQVSAPPASQMPLGAAPPASEQRQSLTRASSASSGASTATADSFVMEMQTISASELSNSSCSSRPSSSTERLIQRRPLIRQRATHMQHAHHQSITSLRELEATPNSELA